MASEIELKRKKLELARVQLARQEQEFKIEERLEEIQRLKQQVELQKKKEEELSQEISTLLTKE